LAITGREAGESLDNSDLAPADIEVAPVPAHPKSHDIAPPLMLRMIA